MASSSPYSEWWRGGTTCVPRAALRHTLPYVFIWLCAPPRPRYSNGVVFLDYCVIGRCSFRRVMMHGVFEACVSTLYKYE